MSVSKHGEQVATLGVLERRDQEIVEDEDVELGETSEHGGVRAVGAGDRELVSEPRDTRAHRAQALAPQRGKTGQMTRNQGRPTFTSAPPCRLEEPALPRFRGPFDR